MIFFGNIRSKPLKRQIISVLDICSTAFCNGRIRITITGLTTQLSAGLTRLKHLRPCQAHSSIPRPVEQPNQYLGLLYSHSSKQACQCNRSKQKIWQGKIKHKCYQCFRSAYNADQSPGHLDPESKRTMVNINFLCPSSRFDGDGKMGD